MRRFLSPSGIPSVLRSPSVSSGSTSLSIAFSMKRWVYLSRPIDASHWPIPFMAPPVDCARWGEVTTIRSVLLTVIMYLRAQSDWKPINSLFRAAANSAHDATRAKGLRNCLVFEGNDQGFLLARSAASRQSISARLMCWQVLHFLVTLLNPPHYQSLKVVGGRTSEISCYAKAIPQPFKAPNDGRNPTLELTPEQRRQRTLDALILQIQVLTRPSPV